MGAQNHRLLSDLQIVARVSTGALAMLQCTKSGVSRQQYHMVPTFELPSAEPRVPFASESLVRIGHLLVSRTSGSGSVSLHGCLSDMSSTLSLWNLSSGETEQFSGLRHVVPSKNLDINVLDVVDRFCS